MGGCVSRRGAGDARACHARRIRSPFPEVRQRDHVAGGERAVLPVRGMHGDARGFLAALAMGADAVCFGTAIVPTKECPASEAYKRKIVEQDIFDRDYHKKIYDFNHRDITVGSMASGHITKSLSVEEFIQNII